MYMCISIWPRLYYFTRQSLQVDEMAKRQNNILLSPSCKLLQDILHKVLLYYNIEPSLKQLQNYLVCMTWLF